MPKYRSINLAIPKLLHSFENITMISASFLKCDFQKASLQSHYAIILHGYQEFEEFLAVKSSHVPPVQPKSHAWTTWTPRNSWTPRGSLRVTLMRHTRGSLRVTLMRHTRGSLRVTLMNDVMKKRR